MKTVEINTDFIKLSQLLKYAGIAESGSVAKHLIIDGFVKVNDEVCFQRGKKIFPEDVVYVEDFGSFKVKGIY